MTEESGNPIARFLARFQRKASDAVATHGASLILGKIAARDVLDENGGVIVAAGRAIDEAVLQRAQAADRVPALVAAVASAKTQDLKERLKDEYERTPQGQGQRNLADSESYLEARHYIRYVAGVEVTDLRGEVLVPAGKVIQDEDVRIAREAGQLAALIYSAQQFGPPAADTEAPQLRPQSGSLPPRRRAAAPLSGGDDEADA